MIKYKTGVDALDYLNALQQEVPKEILNQIDTINWDPPYLENGIGN